MFRNRQIRMTIILLLLVFACAGAGLYLHFLETPASVQASAPVSQETADIVKQFEERGAGDLAVLRKSAPDSVSQRAELVFLGLGDEQTMRGLLQTLQKSGISATFFITSANASENPASLAMISDAGYAVGSAYLGSGADGSMSGKRAVTDLYRAATAIQTAIGVWPSQILSLNPPDDEMLAAAYVCTADTMVLPTKVVGLQEVGTAALAGAVVSELARGSILCVRLSNTGPDADTALTDLCAVLADTDTSARAKTLLAASPDPVEPLKRIYTVEKAVAFTFSGLGDQAELDGVLNALNAVHGAATFFVTRDELTQNPEEIRQILDMGNELGISVQTARFTSTETLLEDILSAEEEIRTTYGYTADLPVRSAFGSASDILKQACGAGGFPLLTAMVNAVRTDDIRKTDASAVLDQVFPAADGVLQRGEIVHFQMKQYQKSNEMLGNFVKLVATQKNIYAVKPVMAIRNNTEYTYTYPLPVSAILPSVKDRIYPGQLTGNPMTAIASRYIGIDWVASSSFLPGFTAAEIKRLDKKGLVPNDSNMVFLSFDDWGSDQAITAILNVLKAHDAKATFFVRTGNVGYNPNLLRAIAAEGHTIGCHTHSHYPLSIDSGNGKKFTELTDEQVATLKQDMVTSYDLLQSIVGDMTFDGHPSLSGLFRPPTLAVGKNGLQAVFDCGFIYSVSGTYTSQDYKATSAASLASTLKKNTKSGAVLIMHMSDTSIYTPEALDIYLSEMDLRAADKRYKFVGLNEALD